MEGRVDPADRGRGVSGSTTAALPEAVRRAAELAHERKAQDVVVLDLRGISSATDYFVIASGTSDVQVRSVAEFIRDELRDTGTRADHVEGLRAGTWVLLDYIDMVVHVFHQQARAFYQLETLWGDAPRIEFGDDGSVAESPPGP